MLSPAILYFLTSSDKLVSKDFLKLSLVCGDQISEGSDALELSSNCVHYGNIQISQIMKHG